MADDAKHPSPISVSDFDRRVYTACSEVREGGIGEIEVEEVSTMEDGFEHRITFTVRREVRHFCSAPTTDD
jgi:hypothetical protein